MEQAVVAIASSCVLVICCCFPGKAGVAMTIVCQLSQCVHGHSIRTPLPLTHLSSWPPVQWGWVSGGARKDVHTKMLKAALQHGAEG